MMDYRRFSHDDVRAWEDALREYERRNDIKGMLECCRQMLRRNVDGTMVRRSLLHILEVSQKLSRLERQYYAGCVVRQASFLSDPEPLNTCHKVFVYTEGLRQAWGGGDWWWWVAKEVEGVEGWTRDDRTRMLKYKGPEADTVFFGSLNKDRFGSIKCPPLPVLPWEQAYYHMRAYDMTRSHYVRWRNFGCMDKHCVGVQAPSVGQGMLTEVCVEYVTPVGDLNLWDSVNKEFNP